MKCSVQGCERFKRYAGLCGMHYKRRWRHGDPTKTLTPTRGFEKTTCIAYDCERLADYSNGLCEKHYNMQLVYGRTHTIVNRGSKETVNMDGYVVLQIGGVRIYEHIYKAVKALGKPLPKGAVVHHVNEIKYDNDTPFNLVVCPNQAYHFLLHKRAKELGYGKDH